MSLAAFLSELRRLDISVWLEGDKLRCSAPPGALTAELRDQLRQRKNDILGFLQVAQAVVAQQSAIVPLQPHGSAPPVFGVPGGGDVFCYRALALTLGNEQPFFGLQAPGLDGRSEPLTRVEDLAAYFAEQIVAFRPRGPWIIAGKCLGGAVALEVARLLLSSDASSGFLALFGTPYPTMFRKFRLLRHRIELRAHLWRQRARILAAQSARERLKYVIWRLQRFKEKRDAAQLLHDKVLAVTVEAVRVYEPRPFAGRVHFFAPCAAWARRSHIHALEVYAGPDGCTEDDMLLPHYAPAFAEHFRRALAAEMPRLVPGSRA